MSSKLREKYLLYRIQTKRDATAYGELYDGHVAGVFRFISFRVGSKEEAEDITSEVFLRTWHYLLERRDVVSFPSLVYRIARNMVIDHYRRRKTHISLDEAIESDDELSESNAGTDDGEQIRLIDVGIEADKVLEAMKQMKADYREVLMLKYIEEMSVSEISEVINKSQVHVRVLLHRATKTLGALLSPPVATGMDKKI